MNPSSLPAPGPRILHLDIDAFLASVEQLLEPGLKGRPVAVGAGVVASCSYEAKARGVKTAMPLGQALRICPELVVRDGNSQVVARFGERVADVVGRFAPLVEMSSLDDLYADLSGVLEPTRVVAERIRATVREETGLSVSQGIGSTRVVARLATVKAKPAGIHEVRLGSEAEFLASHLVADIPGIGRSTQKTLAEFNIHTVRELLLVERDLLKRTFGARGEEIFWRIRGLDQQPVEPREVPKTISRETSFAAETSDRSFVVSMLGYLLDRAASELREHGLSAGNVAVRLRYADYRGAEAERSLLRASDRTEVLLQLAIGLLRHLDTRRVLVRFVGVTLGKLTAQVLSQGELFRQKLEERRQGLDRAVDSVRHKHGFGKLVVGPAVGLVGKVAQDANGFRLRTPSLSK
jgi:DNA polymerase-4